MNLKSIKINTVFLSFLLITASAFSQSYDTTKPWTYWWWMGSAVEKTNIDRELQEFKACGIGGVHIIPIYGAKGYEDQYKLFLSEEWMEMVEYTMKKASSLNLGVDITAGTGWPYGGAMIAQKDAAKKLVVKSADLTNTNRITWNIDRFMEKKEVNEMVEIFAFNGDQLLKLSDKVKNGRLNHKVPKGDWKITLVATGYTGQKVKRAAPGNEGWVMDYFETKSVEGYFDHFDSVFNHSKYDFDPRAIYHDSYEVYNANWTEQFFDRFKEQQGYDLMDYLHVLGDKEHPDYGLIAHDYRATLSELLYSEFTTAWTKWTSETGKMSRNQAHGSPANILDLYSLSDIPETESFGCSNFDIPGLNCDPNYNAEKFGRPSPLMMKFASSAAHLLGKQLVSSETTSWLADHFKVSLRQVKPQVDELWTAGINHIFYHGIAYSPEEEPFPGWLWYASTNFGKRSHFWEELPLLNQYISRGQQLLQNSTPDHDILLYFPIDDLWTKSIDMKLLLLLDVHHYEEWFRQTSFGQVAEQLWDNGYTFDYISDKQIGQLNVDNDHQAFIAAASRYKTLIIPKTEYIPESTLTQLKALANEGLRIVFVEQLPGKYPGFASNRLENIKVEDGEALLSEYDNFLVTNDLEKDLTSLRVEEEMIKSKGLDFIRKKTASGHFYFITNLSSRAITDSIGFTSVYRSIRVTDPLSGNSGMIQTTGKILLNIPPGKSYLVETFENPVSGKDWISYQPTNTTVLRNSWQVEFQATTGPQYSQKAEVSELTSWLDWKDANLEYFSGKAHYQGTFSLGGTDPDVKQYRLAFDEIRETAQVIVNGVDCGTIWAFPNELVIPAHILKEENQLEIVVGNLSHNYMRKFNKEHPEWMKFHDINFVNIRYEAFEPENGPAEPSGLIGNVYLNAEK